MNKKIFLSALFDSFWNWLLGGIFMIFSVITFFRPDLQPTLSFVGLSKILSPFGLMIIGFIILILGFVWNIRNKLREIKREGDANQQPKNVEVPVVKGGKHYGSGDSYTAQNMSIYKNAKEDTDKRKNVRIIWNAAEESDSEKKYMSVEIESNENELIKCYCVIKSIKIDGIIRDDIRRKVTSHTNRVSWSGGEDEQLGIKYIEPFGRINLASVSMGDLSGSLQFETAKGTLRDKFPFGKYSIEVSLLGTLKENEFDEVPILINFEYAEKERSFEDSNIHMGKEVYKVLRLVKDYFIDEYEDKQGRINRHPRVGLIVKNNSTNDISDCWAKLTSVKFIFPDGRESMESIGQINPHNLNLSWDGVEQKEFYTLRKNGGDGVVNLIETGIDGRPNFMFFGKKEDGNPPGTYKIQVEIHLGDKTEVVEKMIESNLKADKFKEIVKDNDVVISEKDGYNVYPYLIFK